MTVIRIFDFETTGVEPPAEVCEVGYSDFDVETGVIADPVARLCGVSSMPPEVRAVHHIALSECEGQPPFNPALLFSEHLSAVAAHNASFELKFCAPPVPVICTYKAALRVWPEAPSHSNGALRYWLEDAGKIVPNHALTQPAHRAGPDAYTTAHILKALFDAGHTGREMVAWSKEPPVLPTCPIGKFRGMPWPEVEGGFLGWMVRQPTMDPDLIWNAKREIARRQAEGVPA